MSAPCLLLLLPLLLHQSEVGHRPSQSRYTRAMHQARLLQLPPPSLLLLRQ
jgi:hypothetical protein